jgi:hypothetical protein
MKWISCKDRLPSRRGMKKNYMHPYWGYIKDHPCMYLLWFEYGKKFIDEDGFDWTDVITHWTPLPPPPKDTK